MTLALCDCVTQGWYCEEKLVVSHSKAKANCRIPMVSSTLDFLMSKSCGEQIMSEFSIVMTEETLKVVLSFPMKIFQSRLVILG